MIGYLQVLTIFLTCSAAHESTPADHEESTPVISKAMAEATASNYKTLSPLVITIIKAGKVYGYLRLELQLATKDGHSIESLQPLFPVLVDAYNTKLYSLIGDRWIPGQPLPQESILKIIQDLTDKISNEKVKNANIKVYLKNFFFSPANK